MVLGNWLFMTTMVLVIFVGCGLIGCQGHPEVMLALNIGLPFMLLDLQRNKWQAFTVAGVILLLYLVLQFVDFQKVYFDGEHADLVIPIVRIFSVVTVIGILLSQFWHLVSVSSRYMNKLQDTTEDLWRQAKVKEEFLAHISHELRTPLNAINGLSSIILRDPHGPNEQRLTTIAHSGRHMLGLINNILDYSKLSASEFEFNGEPVGLSDFAANLETAFKPLAQEKSLDFEVVNHSDLDGVIVDPKHLQQILNNLIGNAIKFTSEGSVNVSIESMPHLEGWSKIVFAIIDSGKGIPSDQQHQVFEAFNQGSKLTSVSHGGTGLGLSIARQLAYGMGGELKLVESRPGHTHFECILALETITLEAKQEVNIDFEGFEGQRVLVVDDNRINCMVMQQYLSLQGMQVVVAENGEDALKEVNNAEFDVILMDLRMPGIDGFETSHRIRKRGIDTPIIALSASQYHEIKERLTANGINDFQMKPFEPAELSDKLRLYIKAS